MTMPARNGRIEDAVPTVRARRREWIGLAVLALPCILYSMDLTVLNLAVPRLSADLAPSSTQLLWIVDIYGFVLAGALIPMGGSARRRSRAAYSIRKPRGRASPRTSRCSSSRSGPPSRTSSTWCAAAPRSTSQAATAWRRAAGRSR